MQPRPALFLDRDGVIVAESHYLADPDQVCLLSGAGDALARSCRAGIPLVVITNQSGVARGFFSEGRVVEVHHRLNELLAAHGAWIDHFYSCPHHPTEGVGVYRTPCECRKPAPGMLLQAAHQLNLDLSLSFMIGDKICDLAAGAAAGCRTILVRTGYGDEQTSKVRLGEHNLMLIARDLPEALDFCLPQLVMLRESA